MIKVIAALTATAALFDWMLFGPMPVNTFHFYFGLTLLIITINNIRRK